MITYYLSLDNSYCIDQAFQVLTNYILEPGIHYDSVNVENKFIVLNSIYKYDYLKDRITQILKDIGYVEEFYLEKQSLQIPLR